MGEINEVKELIRNSNNIVFFGGAGVSTASGVPDFRSATGLYNRENKSDYSPEYMLSHEFFVNHPDKFMTYCKENLMLDGIKPNACHYALAKLEKMGKLKAVITQNIDSLHQEAGSKNVIELHGNLRDYYCTSCGKAFDLSYVKAFKDLVKCDSCGGLVTRHSLVWRRARPKQYKLCNKSYSKRRCSHSRRNFPSCLSCCRSFGFL